jgi:hypothetical protein
LRERKPLEGWHFAVKVRLGCQSMLLKPPHVPHHSSLCWMRQIYIHLATVWHPE